MLLPNYLIESGRKAAENTVVEIYNYRVYDSKVSYWEVQQVLQKQKRVACLSDKSGKFSFSNLKVGNYFLRIGTRDPKGLNEVYIVVSRHQQKVKAKERGLKSYFQPELKFEFYRRFKHTRF